MTTVFYGRKDGKIIFSATEENIQVFSQVKIDNVSDTTIEWLNNNFGAEHVNPNFSWSLIDVQTKEQRENISRYLTKNQDTEAYETTEATEEVSAPTVKIEYVKCACGHTCDKRLVMSTSRGSSCPDCYDDMSL